MVRVIPPKVPVVRSLEDTYRWVDHCVHMVHHHLGVDALERLERSIMSTSVSTAFSGIGVAELANSTVAHAIHSYTGKRLVQQNLWACEWRTESRYELMMAQHPPQHIFEDINNFIDIGSTDSTLERNNSS